MDTHLLPLPVLLALGLASYRGVQLLVWDKWLDGPRTRFALYGATRSPWWYRFLSAVWQCPYCCGMYVSAVALIAYRCASGSWDWGSWLIYGVEWFVVAGIQALLNRWDDSRP